MTLFKQLFAGISVLFLVLLAGVETIYLVNARAQLGEQLGAQAQDAATTLSLRLSSLKSLDDRALVEATVNPIFDRGYFREIHVVSLEGAVIVRKKLALGDALAPAWFVRMLPIEAPEAQSLVSSGWRQLGRIIVVSQPHFAQVQLWRAGVQTLAWLVLGYLVALAAAATFLAMLLRPLREIERAAIAIGERDMVTISLLPSARELARVVQAINEMSRNIRKVMQEEGDRAEAYRREAFVDPLTGLYNRRGFERQLQSLAQSTGDVYAGALALAEIREFGEFNARVGYQRGDEVITVLAAAVSACFEGKAAIGARLGGAGFGFAVLNTDKESLEVIVESLCNRLGRVLTEQGLETELHFHCGAAHHDGDLPELSSMLAAADHAVELARAKGENTYVVETFDPSVGLGSQAWGNLLRACLEENRITLFAQEVAGIRDGKLLQVEVTARLRGPDDVPIPAAQFLPMAFRHGLAGEVDCRVLEMLIGHLAAGSVQGRVALNVAAWSIADAESCRRIYGLLDSRPVVAARLIFEMTEFGALQDLPATQRFAAAVRSHGAGFALDTFGMRKDTLQLVHALRPHYIKLSAAYCLEVAASADCRFLVSSLVRVTRPLGIAVYAQSVEDPALVPLLAELGLEGYQGYALARPRPLE